MSSPDSTKKRRIAVSNGSGDDNGIVDDGITMSTILAKLNDMENRFISMQSELDKCNSSRESMQKEMDGMQSRLSHIDELEKKCDRLEKECTHLDIRCDSLQRSVEILSKESKWKYSAPPIPLSHWRGFPEDYVDSMQTLLSDINEYTRALRSGKNIALSTLYLGLDDEALLQHDDMLLPHWEELANALQLYNKEGGLYLSITNIQLTSSVIYLLAPALKGKPINGLTLFNNDFEDTHKGIEFIAECIKFNDKLKKFHWTGNQIDNQEDAHRLLKSIIDNPSIENVRLENCLRRGDINSYHALCYLLARDKRCLEIDFDNNNINTGGNTNIQDYIASNPPLKSLLLSGNKLNDDDIILIAQALKCNTNLKHFRLHDNNITHIGQEALSKAVYDPTSLNSISDCNHTCRIHVDGGIKNVPLGCGNDNRKFSSSISKRGAKIYQLLSKRNKEGSNVRHFESEFEIGDEEEDSLKLVPKVLECIHSYPRASKLTVHPLSILFEVIRGWKMPELYANRS